MRRNDTTMIGDIGEAEALRLLTERGYTGCNLNDRRRNAWTYDLEIDTVRGKVLISVKTARAKRDVSLGKPRSLERLADDAFLMILMPAAKKQEIQVSPGGYHLLIVPGDVARDEALSMHYEYWGEEVEKAAENTVRVKDEINRPGSRSRAGHVFANWNERFRDAWYILPEPSSRSHSAGERVEKPLLSGTLASQNEERVEPKSLSSRRASVTEKRSVGAEIGEKQMTPQKIVDALNYLQSAGLPAENVCAMHHFEYFQSYSQLITYFSSVSYLRSETNRYFGERLAYVSQQHKQGRYASFASLVSEALQRWPLHI